jgi:uncharacterized protein YggU (UPF0235/DUF167 family)
MDGWFRMREDGLDLFVRLTPRASKDAIEQVEATADGRAHLSARVRAVPEKGAANVALERLLAGRIGLPKSAVSVVSGSTARLKTVRLTGDPAALVRMLELALGSGRP